MYIDKFDIDTVAVVVHAVSVADVVVVGTIVVGDEAVASAVSSETAL